MTRRSKPTSRRGEIVDAALRLLGSTPLADLTTRKIAREVGVSQPALFRHFRSRGRLLLAVVEQARSDLGGVAEHVLGVEGGPIAQIEALVRGLLAHVERHPGLPRLLFSDAPEADAELAARLRQLMSMQVKLAAELARQAQRDGALRASVDAERLASLLVALIQGVILQWQRGALTSPLSEMAGSLLDLWLDGARRRGHVAEPRSAEPAASVSSGPGPAEGLVALDARPILAAGSDPLDDILAAMERAGRDGLVLLTAPFRPAPLLKLVASRGWEARVEQVADACWEIEMRGPDAPAIEDARDLPAPEPLEHVLMATAKLAPGASLLARVPRFPRLLLPHLEERGFRHRVVERRDGSALLHVRKPA